MINRIKVFNSRISQESLKFVFLLSCRFLTYNDNMGIFGCRIREATNYSVFFAFPIMWKLEQQKCKNINEKSFPNTFFKIFSVKISKNKPVVLQNILLFHSPTSKIEHELGLEKTPFLNIVFCHCLIYYWENQSFIKTKREFLKSFMNVPSFRYNNKKVPNALKGF